MFKAIGRFVTGHARVVLVAGVSVVIGAGILAFSASGALTTSGFGDPSSESWQAQTLIEERFGGRANALVLITARDGTVDDAAVRQAGGELTAHLAADPVLSDVTSYFATGAPQLRSDDGRHALALGQFSGDFADNEKTVERLRERHAGDRGAITVHIGGTAAVELDADRQLAADLLLAELIAVPMILLLLVLAFRTIVAAVLPVLMGGIAIVCTIAELSVIGSLTDVSIYSINMAVGLGLGLAVDYAMLMTSRFREELAAGLDTSAAVVRTVQTAGRTIVFSAVTVAVALAALLLFPMYFLRSFAYAGIGVVTASMISAVLVLPALLTVLGPKVNAGRLPWAHRYPLGSGSAFWGRLAGAAMRRPLLTGAPVVVLLLLAAVPLLRADLGMPDDRVLPSSAQSRVVGDVLRTHFGNEDSRSIQVVIQGTAEPAAVAGHARRISELPGVLRVTSSAGAFVRGHDSGPAPAGATLARADSQRLLVAAEPEPSSAQARELISAIRALPEPAGTSVVVGGEAALLADSHDAIGGRLPLAIALIAITTFLLLFLFTGSLLQPLRAVAFNVLGLSATIGVLVLVFQEGWLSPVLGFTPSPLNICMLVLMFTIILGLSMDYELFVVSRIKEAHDQGIDHHSAVILGMSRTGRLVSTAAALIAVSLFAFAISGVSFVQMFGIGAGLAVLLDATLIRGVLMPVGMRLLGRHAWWAPAPMRRLHRRVGLREASEPPAHKIPALHPLPEAAR
ncbi:MMPL family transporter [Lentzea jiangxiensis]|uniref:Putative drug exporter of the RND superfamily n=1 Tax=Lentzea jiangxiensis TaxID=641025 RepID=A0A1H0JXH2_9PSEU|nr:MMPL family transporter [Lentzea jiangxiensis]SDO48488.1 putative drug exporter of the RND superfamily [Lentzea jiangxiensis]